MRQETLREEAIKSMAKRPGYGKFGRQTQLLTNYFEVKKIANVAHFEKYEITMKLQQRFEGEGSHRRKVSRQPKQLPAHVQRAIFQQLEKQERNGWFKGVGVVFDGNTTIYSTGLLNLNSDSGTTSVTLKDDQDFKGNPTEYKVEIKRIDKIDLGELKKFLEGKEMKWEYFDLAGLRGLNALIHHMPSMKYTQFGESTYLPSTRKSLGGGVELWMGWFESVRPGQDNIPERFTQQQQDKVSELVRGLQFKAIHRPKVNTRFKIKRLCSTNARENMVDIPDSGEKISIYSYYQRRYNRYLKYLHLVELEGRKNDKIPIELCNIIEGQRFPVAKLSSAQRGHMIKHTALRPQENMDRIAEGVQNVLQFEKDFKLKRFGMGIEEKMTVTPGIYTRILKAPKVSYHITSKAGGTVKPREGGWNLRDRKFVRSGKTLQYWVVVAFVQQQKLSISQAKQFIKELVNTSRSQGMDIAEGNPRVNYVKPNGEPHTYQQLVVQEYNNARDHLKNDLQLMLFILPDDDEKRYRAIKYTADTVLGVPSQCVQVDKVGKTSKQYCANIALKMNLKLGGTNQSLEDAEIPLFAKEPVLLLGADVTHPTGGRAGPSNMPSICAIVGSLDRQGGRFTPKLESQKTRQEKIENMSGMVFEILRDYRDKNSILPRRIIMYRDGVSESQFEMACMKTEQDYRPPITFVVVGKRHHTRFYPRHERDADSKGNCVAGTVVDQKITHPYLFDFYHVLFDENNFTADSLQDLTNKLCYNYQRATRSVSISPAASWSDYNCTCFRLHLEQQQRGETEFVLKEVKESLAKVFLAIYLFGRMREFERFNNNNLEKIKLNQEFAEKRRKLEHKAVEITRKKIQNLNEYQKFSTYIPGSNHIMDIENLIEFRNRLDCIITKGNWVLDLTPRPLIRHKQDSIYGKCYKRYQNSSNISVEEIWKLIPDSTKYVWKTPKECPMPKINVEQARELISGHRFLIVGDKLQFQFHELLLDFFHEGPVQCYGENACKDHILCNITSDSPDQDRKISIMKYIRNDILSHQKIPPLDIKDFQLPWVHVSTKYNVMILNKGHHWHDDETFRNSLIDTVRAIRKRSDKNLIIYRATTLGHLNCKNIDRPLPVPPNATELDNLPYHWGDIHRQNLIAKEIIEGFGGVFLDMESVMITRADGHIDGRDCLRWCIPGPADVWLDFLFYILSELL
ncbi:8457_t:CDS:10 [Cetraspora pellucida]|uniref:8457_t:CDS:1 n=1 Tax=Cetraspora pellucida TaxID=1433469 RepID=A0A9N9AE43_9GLOM|nr:8457_t:CDS:10 [Cetraspora pellucida]